MPDYEKQSWQRLLSANADEDRIELFQFELNGESGEVHSIEMYLSVEQIQALLREGKPIHKVLDKYEMDELLRQVSISQQS